MKGNYVHFISTEVNVDIAYSEMLSNTLRRQRYHISIRTTTQRAERNIETEICRLKGFSRMNKYAMSEDLVFVANICSKRVCLPQINYKFSANKQFSKGSSEVSHTTLLSAETDMGL